MAPKIQILATDRDANKNETCYIRVQYTDTQDAQSVESIRYIRVFPDVLPANWLLPTTDIQLPEFPGGDWNVVDLTWTKGAGTVAAANPCTVDMADIYAWHPHSIDYFSLEKLVQLPFAGVRTRRSDSMWLVRHKFFPVPVLMKIAEVPPLGRAQNETMVYRSIEGKGIAPRFLAHVTEDGQITGFLLEFIEGGRRPWIKDLVACRTVLKKLHGEGFVHNDAHPGNFIVKPDGTALLIDFEYTMPGLDKSRFLEEIESLPEELRR